jgi:hypothetical protein
MANKNFIVKNGLEVGGQEVVSSSGVVTSAALGGQTLASTDSPTFNNLTLTNDIAVGGDINLTGDLNITGDVNTLSVTDLDVTDQTITLGKGQVESASGGSGIVIDGSSASILWDETNDTFDINKGIDVTGTVVADGLDIDGDTTLEGTTSTDATTAATAVSEAILRVKPHADIGNSLWFSLANSADPVLQAANFDGASTNDLLLNPFGGNVGIGTSSPASSTKLNIKQSAVSDINGLNGIRLDHSTGTAYSGFGLQNTDTLITAGDAGGTANTNLLFRTAVSGSEATRMRLDSSGNLLVGTTDTTLYNNSDGSEGVRIAEDHVSIASNARTVFYVNRQTSDGEIIDIRKDGTTVGSIGAYSSRMYLGTGDTGVFFDSITDDAIKPWNTSTNAGRDAEIDLGGSSTRFKDLYLSGTVNATQIDITESTNARMYSSDAISEVGSGTFALQVVNSAGSALKPLGFRAEDIRFATGSSERMRIDSSGRVGINQTPLANNFALQVTGLGGGSGDARAVYLKGSGAHTTIGGTAPTLVLQNTNSTANNITKLSFESASSGETVSINSITTNHSSHYGDMAFNTRGSAGYSEKMRIMANGNVGINTTSPATTLHVTGTIGAFSGNNDNRILMYNNGTVGSINVTYGTIGPYLPLTFLTGDTERMRIDSSGNVGIGTTNPSGFFADSYLVVGDGTGTPTSTIYGSSTGTSYLLFADGTTGSAAYAGGIEYSHSSDFLSFFVNGGSAMKIDSAKRVIMGSGGALHFSGNVSSGFITESGVNLQLRSDGAMTFYTYSGGWQVRMTIADGGLISGDFNDTSDVSLKENIVAIDDGMSVISQMRPVSFDWKDVVAEDKEGNEVTVPSGKGSTKGLIAQEVEAIDAELVVGEEGEKAINTSGVLAYAIKAIQEQQTIIDDLKARLDEAGL